MYLRNHIKWLVTISQEKSTSAEQRYHICCISFQRLFFFLLWCSLAFKLNIHHSEFGSKTNPRSAPTADKLGTLPDQLMLALWNLSDAEHRSSAKHNWSLAIYHITKRDQIRRGKLANHRENRNSKPSAGLTKSLKHGWIVSLNNCFNDCLKH